MFSVFLVILSTCWEVRPLPSLAAVAVAMKSTSGAKNWFTSSQRTLLSIYEQLEMLPSFQFTFLCVVLE